jgi:3-phenylpropionate/trans-cinnamate dioxygenase ferredoxin component
MSAAGSNLTEPNGERACSLDDLPDVGAIQVVIAGEMIAVVRDEQGDVHAISDMCTHATVPLSEGEVDDCTIECWLHGSRFDLRTGEPTGLPAITPVDVYPVTIEGDDVYVDTSRTVGQDTASPAAASKES